MTRLSLLPILLTFALPLAAQTAGPKPTLELTDEIKAADVALFSAFFDRCDVEALKGMVTDDFEMIHDKGGRVASSGKEFIANIEGTCARQKTGEDYRARRELVAGSLKVYPVNNYGAIEVGEHRFFQLLPASRKLVEVSLFTQVWKKEGSVWKLARASAMTTASRTDCADLSTQRA